MKSYHRFIVTANGEEDVPSMKGTRRDLLIRCSDEKVQTDDDDAVTKAEKFKYHQQMYHMKDDEDSVRTIYHYYKTLPNVPYKITKDQIPVTEFQKTIQGLYKSCLELFFEDLTVQNADKASICVTNTNLWTQFQLFCDKNGHRYGESANNMNSNQFANRVGRLQIDGIGKSEPKWFDGKKQNVRTLDIARLKKHFGFGQCLLADKLGNDVKESDVESDEESVESGYTEISDD